MRPGAKLPNPTSHESVRRQIVQEPLEDQAADHTLVKPPPTDAPDVALPCLRSPMAMSTCTDQPAQPVQPSRGGSVSVPRRSVSKGNRRPDWGQPEPSSQQPASSVPRMANTNRSPKNTSSSQPHLRRVTINLTPAGRQAVKRLTATQNLNLTDTINRALQIAALVNDLAPENRLRIVQPDDTIAVIYLL